MIDAPISSCLFPPRSTPFHNLRNPLLRLDVDHSSSNSHGNMHNSLPSLDSCSSAGHSAVLQRNPLSPPGLWAERSAIEDGLGRSRRSILQHKDEESNDAENQDVRQDSPQQALFPISEEDEWAYQLSKCWPRQTCNQCLASGPAKDDTGHEAEVQCGWCGAVSISRILYLSAHLEEHNSSPSTQRP